MERGRKGKEEIQKKHVRIKRSKKDRKLRKEYMGLRC